MEADAGRNGQKNTANPGGGVRYSIVDNGGKRYVQADRQVLYGDDPDVWKRQITDYINQKIRQGQDVLFPTEDGHVLALTERSAYKLTDRHRGEIAKKGRQLLSDAEYALKGRVAAHIDELIQVGQFDSYKSDTNNAHENDIGEDGFNYFEAYFKDEDGIYYRVTFSSALNENEETVYSIGRIRQRKPATGRGSSVQTKSLTSDFNGAQKGGELSSDDIIFTSEKKSQEKKTSMQVALEQAKQQKDQRHSAAQKTSGKYSIEAAQEDAQAEAEAPRRLTVELARDQLKAAVKRLKATEAEREFARGIAAGHYQDVGIPEGMRKEVVEELTDCYDDLIQAQRDRRHKVKEAAAKEAERKAKTVSPANFIYLTVGVLSPSANLKTAQISAQK